MRAAFFTAPLLVLTLLCNAQKGHKNPVYPQYSKEALTAYHAQVFQLLHEGLADVPVARYTTLPALSCEYAFSAAVIDGKKFVVSSRLSENLWLSKNKREVRINREKTEISEELYGRISELFILASAITLTPEDKQESIDGTIHYFEATSAGGQVKIMEIHAPSDHPKIRELVQICDKICQFGHDKKVIAEQNHKRHRQAVAPDPIGSSIPYRSAAANSFATAEAR